MVWPPLSCGSPQALEDTVAKWEMVVGYRLSDEDTGGSEPCP